MASGKSTVAQAVSALTGWPSIDNDVVLERSTGRTAEQLLAQDGLAGLRSAESDVLTLELSLPAPVVAGVPAGVVLDPRDRERLRAGGHVVWLRVPVDVLARRVSGKDHRPFLDGDPRKALAAMAAEREALYAEVAHQVLDLPPLTPARAAREIVAAVTG